ncbi:unnamed protein product [Amoebophrya sp. A25]|nr:unnamed protein product [Amoebophrya sp. A25]|eukprot:GSA25T00016938001.1
MVITTATLASSSPTGCQACEIPLDTNVVRITDATWRPMADMFQLTDGAYWIAEGTVVNQNPPLKEKRNAQCFDVIKNKDGKYYLVGKERSDVGAHVASNICVFRKGDFALRSGQLCTVVSVGHSEDPPFLSLQILGENKEVGTELSRCEKVTYGQGLQWKRQIDRNEIKNEGLAVPRAGGRDRGPADRWSAAAAFSSGTRPPTGSHNSSDTRGTFGGPRYGYGSRRYDDYRGRDGGGSSYRGGSSFGPYEDQRGPPRGSSTHSSARGSYRDRSYYENYGGGPRGNGGSSSYSNNYGASGGGSGRPPLYPSDTRDRNNYTRGSSSSDYNNGRSDRYSNYSSSARGGGGSYDYNSVVAGGRGSSSSNNDNYNSSASSYNYQPPGRNSSYLPTTTSGSSYNSSSFRSAFGGGGEHQSSGTMPYSRSDYSSRYDTEDLYSRTPDGGKKTNGGGAGGQKRDILSELLMGGGGMLGGNDNVQGTRSSTSTSGGGPASSNAAAQFQRHEDEQRKVLDHIVRKEMMGNENYKPPTFTSADSDPYGGGGPQAEQGAAAPCDKNKLGIDGTVTQRVLAGGGRLAMDGVKTLTGKSVEVASVAAGIGAEGLKLAAELGAEGIKTAASAAATASADGFRQFMADLAAPDSPDDIKHPQRPLGLISKDPPLHRIGLLGESKNDNQVTDSQFGTPHTGDSNLPPGLNTFHSFDASPAGPRDSFVSAPEKPPLKDDEDQDVVDVKRNIFAQELKSAGGGGGGISSTSTSSTTAQQAGADAASTKAPPGTGDQGPAQQAGADAGSTKAPPGTGDQGAQDSPDEQHEFTPASLENQALEKAISKLSKSRESSKENINGKKTADVDMDDHAAGSGAGASSGAGGDSSKMSADPRGRAVNLSALELLFPDLDSPPTTACFPPAAKTASSLAGPPPDAQAKNISSSTSTTLSSTTKMPCPPVVTMSSGVLSEVKNADAVVLPAVVSGNTVMKIQQRQSPAPKSEDRGGGFRKVRAADILDVMEKKEKKSRDPSVRSSSEDAKHIEQMGVVLRPGHAPAPSPPSPPFGVVPEDVVLGEDVLLDQKVQEERPKKSTSKSSVSVEVEQEQVAEVQEESPSKVEARTKMEVDEEVAPVSSTHEDEEDAPVASSSSKKKSEKTTSKTTASAAKEKASTKPTSKTKSSVMKANKTVSSIKKKSAPEKSPTIAKSVMKKAGASGPATPAPKPKAAAASNPGTTGKTPARAMKKEPSPASSPAAAAKKSAMKKDAPPPAVASSSSSSTAKAKAKQAPKTSSSTSSSMKKDKQSVATTTKTGKPKQVPAAAKKTPVVAKKAPAAKTKPKAKAVKAVMKSAEKAKPAAAMKAASKGRKK